MTQDIYYKVVSQKMNSAFLEKMEHGIPNPLKTHYKIGEWTYPDYKPSKLFVFSSLKSAFIFAYHTNGRVFSCIVINPKKSGPFNLDIASSKYWAEIKKMWKLYKNKKKYIHLKYGQSLKNTVWVDAVKLLKEEVEHHI